MHHHPAPLRPRSVKAGSKGADDLNTGTSAALRVASATPDARYVRALDGSLDEPFVGGKARNLARLLGLGSPVPPGLVLTRDGFDRVLNHDGLRQRIEDVCQGSRATNGSGQRAAAFALQSALIGDLVMRATWPPDITASVEALANAMLPGVVAVRSSAVGEDGGDASFAGQFDSILGVESALDLANAIRRCWASHWSARALFYRHSRCLPPRGMAVVIQRQVQAAVAGVLFTVDPGGGEAAEGSRSARIIIEACGGLADGLVSGRVEPDRFVVSRDDGTVVSMAVADQDPHRGARGVLLDRLPELVQYALAIEEAFASPQDIEWAIDVGGRIWIVQTRPITTLQRGSSGSPARGGETVSWSNANVNENFPEPISPFLYSIASIGYYHYFRNLGFAFGVSRRRLAAMERPLRGIIGVHGARMYYNLSSIHGVLRMAPFGEALGRAFNRFVGTDGSAPPPRGAIDWASRRGRVSQALEVARIVLCTAWQYVFLRRRIEAFERTADAFAARTRPDDLSRRSLPELGDDLQAFLTIRFHKWKNASLADAAAMVSYALLERSLRDVGEGASLHSLLRALPGVPSGQPPIRLWALSRLIRADDALRDLFATRPAPAILDALHDDPRFDAFRRDFDRFLDDWGFRSSGELMLTVPSLQEQPQPAIDLLKQYATCDGEPPESAMERQAAERAADTARVYRRLRFRAPVGAFWIRLVLGWTQRSVCYRERARLKQALLYTRCRRVATAIGDRLVRSGAIATRDDVFMLTWNEVQELVSGLAMFPYSVRRLVEMRRSEHEQLAAMRPPDAMDLGEGEYLPAGPTAGQDRETPPPAQDATAQMRGTSACGGKTTARAAVVADVSASHLLTRGDVLVTRQTDPGWGPVFCLISGLVIERGGMLSHGAILAREFGLPCVVGVKDATRLIPHGARVTVDGDGGTCSIAGPAPHEPEMERRT